MADLLRFSQRHVALVKTQMSSCFPNHPVKCAARVELLTPLHTGVMARSESSASLGVIPDANMRRLFIDLLLTLNTTFPDYDFR